MLDMLFWIFTIALIVGALVVGAWYYKTHMVEGDGSSGLFGARAERRLGVVEQSNVDGRRKLVLVRRDGVEHLIMTGGPVDLVIETGIGERQNVTALSASSEKSAPVFARAPRSLGQVAGE